MSIPMTPEDALSTLAKAAEALGPPFDTNPLAQAGKVLHDEIFRLRSLKKELAVARLALANNTDGSIMAKWIAEARAELNAKEDLNLGTTP